MEHCPIIIFIPLYYINHFFFYFRLQFSEFYNSLILLFMPDAQCLGNVGTGPLVLLPVLLLFMLGPVVLQG